MTELRARPAFVDPAEAQQAHQILARPAGVPLGRENLSDAPPSEPERLSPVPTELPDDQAWFFPALLYAMVGVDRSIFGLFSHSLREAVPVRTYRSEMPLALMQQDDVTANPWFYTLQGIPSEHARSFVEYVESFEFTDRSTYSSWAIQARFLRVADPFYRGSTRRGIDMCFLLPELLAHPGQRGASRVAVAQEPGLHLQPPVLAVVPVVEPPT